MTTDLTPRSAAYLFGGGRPRIDRTAVRYFVYTLTDADGRPVYVGRSCNVATRIAAHNSDADRFGHKPWIREVRAVSMVGPFTWDEAVRQERETIERLQPRANIDFTARDRRPAVASRSAARAEG